MPVVQVAGECQTCIHMTVCKSIDDHRAVKEAALSMKRPERIDLIVSCRDYMSNQRSAPPNGFPAVNPPAWYADRTKGAVAK